MHQFDSLANNQQLQHTIRDRSQNANNFERGSRSIRYLPKRSYKAEIHDALGPDPDWVLQCFVDLGLSDNEIARYVGLSLGCIRILAQQTRAKFHAQHRN